LVSLLWGAHAAIDDLGVFVLGGIEAHAQALAQVFVGQLGIVVERAPILPRRQAPRCPRARVAARA
jgi:hypothetical protein